MPTLDPHMPLRAPLAMPTQALGRAPHAPHHPEAANRSLLWRGAVFGPALLGTAALCAGLQSWLAMGGMTWLEWALLALISISFVWVALSVTTALIGMIGTRRTAPARATKASPLSVALLVPIYNENPADVFGNAAAMLEDLERLGTSDRFTLFLLSDTQHPSISAAELSALAALKQDAPASIPVHYRRREHNTDKKVGNILNWVTGWGGAHDAMLVLDADSLMAGRTIVRLADELAADPKTGLVQSFPTLIGAQTLFARTQQFANVAFGWLLAEGLARWAQSEGNYWGHNAMIRTHAFASSAGLPYLSGDRLILSHDFVEAGLLRRAGWRVRFLPRLSGSFEETPGSLIDHVLRDRRWCRGNLQHLRLLGTRGLHPVSRFHLFQGAVAYLMSPAWFFLLLAWALLGKNEQENVITYFREDSPLYPDWPVMTEINSALFLLIMYAVLLTPKLASGMIIALHPKAHKLFGGRVRFLTALMLEIGLSILYAPIMMIQQCRAVLRALLTRSEPWAPQNRGKAGYPLGTLFRFHWLETVFGLMLAWGLGAGLISLWLLPIVVSLIGAIPLSALSALPISDNAPKALRLDSPQTLREPAIVTRARLARDRMRAHLSGSINTPAE